MFINKTTYEEARHALFTGTTFKARTVYMFLPLIRRQVLRSSFLAVKKLELYLRWDNYLELFGTSFDGHQLTLSPAAFLLTSMRIEHLTLVLELTSSVRAWYLKGSCAVALTERLLQSAEPFIGNIRTLEIQGAIKHPQKAIMEQRHRQQYRERSVEHEAARPLTIARAFHIYPDVVDTLEIKGNLPAVDWETPSNSIEDAPLLCQGHERRGCAYAFVQLDRPRFPVFRD